MFPTSTVPAQNATATTADDIHEDVTLPELTPSIVDAAIGEDWMGAGDVVADAAVASADVHGPMKQFTTPAGVMPSGDASAVATHGPMLMTPQQLQLLVDQGAVLAPDGTTVRPNRVVSAPPFAGPMLTGLASPPPLPAARLMRSSRTDASDLGPSDWEAASHDSSRPTTVRSQQQYASTQSAEDTVTVVIPTGPEGAYVQAVNDHRLPWWGDDVVPRRVLEVFKARAGTSVDEANVLPLHPVVTRAVGESERVRSAHIQRRRDDLPTTVTWELPAHHARMYGAASHSVPARPPPLHSLHFSGTPNAIVPQSLMPVTYEALLFQEELARVTVHEASVQCHAVDNARAACDAVVEEFGAADNVLRLQERLNELASTSERCAANTVETMMAAAFHRRHSLLYGGDPAMNRKLLCNPLATATNASGVLPGDYGAELPQIKQEPPEVVLIEDDGRPMTFKTLSSEAGSRTSPVFDSAAHSSRVSVGGRPGTSGASTQRVGKIGAYHAAGLAPTGADTLSGVTGLAPSSDATVTQPPLPKTFRVPIQQAGVTVELGKGEGSSSLDPGDLFADEEDVDEQRRLRRAATQQPRASDDDVDSDADDVECEFFLTLSSPESRDKVEAVCDEVLRTPSDIVDIAFQQCIMSNSTSFVVCNDSSKDWLSEEPVP